SAIELSRIISCLSPLARQLIKPNTAPLARANSPAHPGASRPSPPATFADASSHRFIAERGDIGCSHPDMLASRAALSLSGVPKNPFDPRGFAEGRGSESGTGGT